jgi:hypothetical protein
MDMIVRRVCGLDVHKMMIVACILVAAGEGVRPTKEVRTFSG